jgi:peptide/nickel transport system ATP-binding protein
VVGESGSGKSTLARLVMALEAPTPARCCCEGRTCTRWTPADLRRARAGFQMVFQDPYGSLDPRRTVLQTVAEPLAVLHGASAARTARTRRRGAGRGGPARGRPRQVPA